MIIYKKCNEKELVIPYTTNKNYKNSLEEYRNKYIHPHMEQEVYKFSNEKINKKDEEK